MSQASGKASKTNFGQTQHSLQSHKNQGSPDLDTEYLASGTVVDIRLPGSGKEGYGVLVQIVFDKKVLNSNPGQWFSLKDSYQSIISLYGNREGVLRTPPRVLYRYNRIRFNGGFAELMSDNKQERSFDQFAKNRSGSFIASFTGIAKGGRFFGA